MHVCSHCRLLFVESQAICPHDGAATQPTQAPQVPAALASKLSDFEPFASGQTGVSFLATQTSSGYRGLLKVVPFSALDNSERVRVKRELRKQSRLTHEGLPRIIDGGETASELWLFREFVPGESVAQRIRRLGKLDPLEAFVIAAQAASCLDELQRNGLLHRDVKPSHIVLAPRPATPGTTAAIPLTKLVDAGIASRLSTGSIFDLLGTPAYISPEQVLGKLVSFRSDLYALGCVMFEMLTGKPPFPSDDVRAVLDAHKNAKPPALPSELPSAVDALLASMLAKEPRQRPFSAQQVRRTLEPLLPEGTPLPAPGTRAPLGTPIPRTPLPAVLPPLPSAGQAQDAGPTTDEIELVDLPPSLPSSRNTMPIKDDELGDLEIGGALPPVPKTMMLSDKELRDLAVGNSLPASPGTLIINDDDLRDLEVHTSDAVPAAQPAVSEPFASSRPPAADATSAPKSAAAGSASPVADPAPVAGAAAAAGIASAAAASPVPVPPAASTGPGATSEPAPSATPGSAPRAEATPMPDAPGLTALHETAPTQIFRPRDSDSAPTRAAAPAVAVPPVARPAAAAPADVASRPPVRKRIPGPAIAAAAATALMLLMIAVFASRRDAPANPSASVPPSGSSTTTDQRPAAQAEPSVQVAPALAREGAAPAPVEAQPTAIAPDDSPAPGDSRAEPPYIPELPPEDEREQSPPAEISGNPSTKSGSSADSAARRAAQASSYKAQGRAHYQAGRFRQAAAAYQKAVGQNPNDAGAFAGLAASHLAGGEVDLAIAGYARAVRLQPASSGFHAALGRAYLQKGDRKRARSEYERALELDRNNLAARTALSQLK
jgi:serine/threonine protein kinase